MCVFYFVTVAQLVRARDSYPAERDGVYIFGGYICDIFTKYFLVTVAQLVRARDS